MSNKSKNRKRRSGAAENRRLFASVLKGSLRFFLAGIAAAILMTGCEMIIPQIIRTTVDSCIGNEEPHLPAAVMNFLEGFGGRAYLREHLWVIAAAVVVFALFAAFFRWLSSYENAMGGETLTKNLQDRLFAHIGRLPFAWHMEHPTGDIIQRCTSDVRVIKDFCAGQLFSLVRIVLMIVLAVTFMVSMEGRLTVIAMAFMPIVIAYSLAFHVRIRNQFTQVDEAEGVLSTITQENLTGVRVVRAFGQEAREYDRFFKQNAHYTDLWMKLSTTMAWFWAFGDLFSGLQVFFVVLFGAIFCVQGSMSVGSYLAFISYNSMLIWPIRSLGRMISEMSKTGVSLNRINEILLSEPEQSVTGHGAEPTGDTGIRIEDVSFAFGKAEVLSDVTMEIPQGSTIGILGSTGSGKSTLMHLIDRLYDVPDGQGRITIGGRDVRDIPLAELRGMVGIVLQEPYLFSRTIRENISMTGERTEEERRRAAAIACLSETIEEFTDQYETIIGERGVTLSGGQRQRLAIARMLSEKKPIMIFDDSLSAVDAETDARIRHALSENLGGATVILISHRISTLMEADRIYVMHEGRVVESGTHDELLAAGGTYARIFALQYGTPEERGEVSA